MSIADISGYSATVDLQLHVDGRELPLAEVAPDFCVLKNQEDISSVAAEIVVIIDGQIQRRASPCTTPWNLTPSLNLRFNFYSVREVWYGLEDTDPGRRAWAR